MKFELQPTLENELVALRPLRPDDFEPLYQVASDPKIWEQHPNPDRYKKEVFENYFKGAMESGGAFLVIDKSSGEAAGCTRFYFSGDETGAVLIGYTFVARKFWGKGHNPAMKKLMLQHAFRFVDRVVFHIGSQNLRSQIAIGRVGGVKVGEQPVAYFGEQPTLNFVYQILKLDFQQTIK